MRCYQCSAPASENKSFGDWLYMKGCKKKIKIWQNVGLQEHKTTFSETTGEGRMSLALLMLRYGKYISIMPLQMEF